MKTIKLFSKLALIALFLSPTYSFAQDEKGADELTFASVDVKPIFPGCADETQDAQGMCFMQSVGRHVQTNFNYPEEAKKKNIEGKVFVEFTIDTDGSITNIGVKKSETNMPNPLLKAEAIRLIEGLPKMTAAVKDGEAVAIQLIIPIVFELPKEGKASSGELSFETVDVKPIFPGCEESANAEKCFNQSLAQHIQKNIAYPKLAEESDIEGKVFVQFTITAKGKVTDVNVQRGAHKSLNNEAVRIIKSLPNITPAMHNGKAVAIKYMVPIVFKLN